MLTDLHQPANKRIQELAQTPLLLALLCIAYRQTEQFPAQRHKLYQQAVDYLLTTWDESRGIQRNVQFQQLSLDEKEKLLAEIAHSMFEDIQYLIPQGELNRKIRFYFNSMFEMDLAEREVNQIIAEIEAHHGLWVQQAQEIFSFSHLTLQEYFAARYIVKNQAYDTIEQLMAHVGDNRWQEVFLLVAEMLGDATAFCQAYLQAISELIQQDDTLQKLLQWVTKRSTTGQSSVKSSAHRALIIGLERVIAFNRNRNVPILVLVHAHKVPISRVITASTRSGSFAFFLAFILGLAHVFDPDFDSASDFDFDLAPDFGFDLVSDITLNRVLILDMAMMNDLSLLQKWPERFDEQMVYLQHCSQQLGLDELYIRLQNLNIPEENALTDVWEVFHNRLGEIILAHWGLEKLWELSLEQVEMLEMYLAANLLLVKCLGLATVPDRAAIENQMLLV